MSNDQVSHNTGLIYFNENFTGSGVFYPWDKELYFITAGHVIYGKDFVREFDPKYWCVRDDNDIPHQVLELNGDTIFAKTHDIVLLKLECSTKLSNFNKVRFCTPPRNPQHSLLFRGKYEQAQESATHTGITYNSSHKNSNWFNCDIDRAKLTNNDFKSGSDWLGGWSGSGLFLANHSELICSGVMVEVPAKGNLSQLIFSSVAILAELGFQPEIEDSKIYDSDKIFNAKSLTAILDGVDDKSILEWEINTENNEPLELIDRKLDKLYPKDSFREHKTQVIKGLLTGKTYLATELSKQEQILEIYNQTRKVFDLQNKRFYVNSRAEARKELNGLQKEYEAVIEEQLKGKLAPAEIKMLGIYDVYDWISKCSLDFLKDE